MPALQNLAAAIDILDVGVDGFDALLEAALQEFPFLGREDARDDVEWDQAFLRLGVAIDRKGDADTPEQEFRLAAAEVEHVGFDFVQPLRQFGIGRPDRVVRALHFVEHVCTPAHFKHKRLSHLYFAAFAFVAIFAPIGSSRGPGQRLGFMT